MARGFGVLSAEFAEAVAARRGKAQADSLRKARQALSTRSISVRIAAEVPLLLADPVLFEQVLVNLLKNAQKYAPRGSSIESIASGFTAPAFCPGAGA